MTSAAIAMAVATIIPVPKAAIIDRRAVRQLLLVSVVPVGLWTAALVASSPGASPVDVALRAALAVATPILVCGKWSTTHIIAVAQLLGCGKYAHLVPAASERTVLRAPFWLFEALEIEQVLRSPEKRPHRQTAETSMTVLTLITLAAVGTVDGLLSRWAFSDEGYSRGGTLEISDSRCLTAHMLVVAGAALCLVIVAVRQ